MKDILTQIVDNKRFEVDVQMMNITQQQIEELAFEPRTFHSMRQSLASSTSGIISEFKRKSPSKGWIHPNAKAVEVAKAYAQNGASAISVLTDQPFFGGSLTDLRTIREVVDVPLLRKDFIINEYQLYQARIAGADAILLIAACLKTDKCERLAAKAHELGLEVLLEIHTLEELEYVTENIDMAGINNRNLGTFHTDIQNSFMLAQQLQERTASMKNKPILVSESGISKAETVISLRDIGFKGFLIGETFMKTENPGDTLKEFIKNIAP
jgi:indole-3-glycerol phosphate synthase